MNKRKKIIVIVNTYFQLITAIRLKETLWFSCIVNIIISDQSNGSEKIAQNIEKTGIFENVYWIQNKELCKKYDNLYTAFLKAKMILFGIKNNNYREKYDEMVFYNTDIFVHGLYASLIKNNTNLTCSRLDEGILSYTDSIFLGNSRLKYINKLREIFYHDSLRMKTNNFYCFYPGVYEGNLNKIEIPQIDNPKHMGNILKKIFSVKSEMLNIKEKYIFFTSVYDFEGGLPIGETKLVFDIADMVGRDNLIVKMHPRDNRKVFQDRGIHVFENSEIPWEAMQFNNDFSSKLFLTVTSGSVLGANLIIKKSVKSYFLFKLCDLSENESAQNTVHNLRKLQVKSKKFVDNIEIINDIKRLEEICI